MENRQDALRQWVLDMPGLVQRQARALFAPGALEELMETPRYFDARKIILTGCGAAYAAALGTLEVFQQYTDIFWGTQAIEALEFTRFYSEFSIGEPHTPLVVAVSQSGTTARVVEAMKKTAQMGGNTLLITQNAASPAAQAAQHVLALPAEDLAQDALVQSLAFYTTAQLALLALAQRVGYLRGTLGPETAATWQQALCAYAEQCAAALPAIDEEMKARAADWQAYTRYDFLGDHSQMAAASLCAAKYAEVLGSHCAVNDTEEWCHVNFWIKPPESLPLIMFARQQAPDFSRAVETAGSAQLITRPLMVVTDADKNCFAPGVPVCRLPKLPAGFGWMSPLFHPAPALLLLAHLAAAARPNPTPLRFAAVEQSAIEA